MNASYPYHLVTFCVYVYYVHKHQPKSAPNLTIKLQIVTLSETDVHATFTFTSTFAIYDTLVKPPAEL